MTNIFTNNKLKMCGLLCWVLCYDHNQQLFDVFSHFQINY